MEEKEIMTNEVNEEIEPEIVETKSNTGLKILAGICVAAAAAGAAFWAKKKKAKKDKAATVEGECSEAEEESEEQKPEEEPEE